MSNVYPYNEAAAYGAPPAPQGEAEIQRLWRERNAPAWTGMTQPRFPQPENEHLAVIRKALDRGRRAEGQLVQSLMTALSISQEKAQAMVDELLKEEA